MDVVMCALIPALLTNIRLCYSMPKHNNNSTLPTSDTELSNFPFSLHM